MTHKTFAIPAMVLSATLLLQTCHASAQPADDYDTALSEIIRLTEIEIAATNRNLRTVQTMEEVGNCELELISKSYLPNGELSNVMITNYPISLIDPDTIEVRDWAGIGFRAIEGEPLYVRVALGRGDGFDTYFTNIETRQANKEALAAAFRTLVAAC